MDRWRTLAITFGGLWVVTAAALLVTVVMGEGDTTTEPASELAAPARSSGDAPARTPTATRPGPRGGSPVASVAEVGDDPPTWLSDPTQPLPDDVMARARDQLRAERDEQREERRDEMADELEAFIEDEGLSASQAEKLRQTVDGFRDKMDTMRDSMRSGDADFREVRTTMREAREQLGTDLETQLGEDGAERLRESLFGGAAAGRGGFGPPRPPL
jgi:hypothetical protein